METSGEKKNMDLYVIPRKDETDVRENGWRRRGGTSEVGVAGMISCCLTRKGHVDILTSQLYINARGRRGPSSSVGADHKRTGAGAVS